MIIVVNVVVVNISKMFLLYKFDCDSYMNTE